MTTVQFDDLSTSVIVAAAGAGWEVAILPTVTSTQDVARQIASAHPVQRLAVIADHQQRGRGQAGRTWNAPAGCCLLMSALVRSGLPEAHVGLLPAMASLAAADAILDSTGVSIELAWPNDLLIGGAKAGGVLAEASWVGDRLESVTIGIGVNVNVRTDQLSNLSPDATSLLQELGQPADRSVLAGYVLTRLDDGLRTLQDSDRGPSEILERWRLNLGLEGKSIRVVAGQHLGVTGRVERIEINGRLLISTGAGQLELTAGLSSINLIG